MQPVYRERRSGLAPRTQPPPRAPTRRASARVPSACASIVARCRPREGRHAREEPPMQLGVMIEAQEGLDWDLWRRIARTTEELGFESLWRSDHFFSLTGPHRPN